MRRFLKLVAAIVTGAATIVGIGGASIYLADAYRGVTSELTDLRLSKLADAQKVTITNLNESIAQLTTAIGQKDEELKKTIASKSTEYETLREQSVLKCACPGSA